MAKEIERLVYMNERGESLAFSVRSVYRTNISKDATGISDVRNTILSINSMGQDGDTEIANRIEAREMEIRGVIHERNKKLAREHKRRMARILNPQYKGILYYEYGDFRRLINCKIDGEMTMRYGTLFWEFTIPLEAKNPFWREETKTRNDIATWMGLFEWPEEIPIDEGWEVGYREPSLIKVVINKGDVKTGVQIEFRALGEVTNPMVVNVNELSEFVKLNTTMHSGDVIIVNTAYSEKGVTLIRDGKESDAFRTLDSYSTYIQLEVGDNVFRYSADSNLENLEISFHHDNLYLAV